MAVEEKRDEKKSKQWQLTKEEPQNYDCGVPVYKLTFTTEMPAIIRLRTRVTQSSICVTLCEQYNKSLYPDLVSFSQSQRRLHRKCFELFAIGDLVSERR
ncbi:hypothetical protein OUZ56_020580 [Daphnia magna]|uniref:Uncharacterized protein n=1 Tax=Daphnia magna TaxID=35525 RepID=A0ABQ9ZEU2_9CRUS|nr:hypothetical protein OUZ56_020580 [Daphnia magna]